VSEFQAEGYVVYIDVCLRYRVRDMFCTVICFLWYRVREILSTVMCV